MPKAMLGVLCAAILAAFVLTNDNVANAQDKPAEFDVATERKKVVTRAFEYLKSMYNKPPSREDRQGIQSGWGPKAMNVPYTALVLQGLYKSEVWDADSEMVKDSVNWLIESQETTGAWSFIPGMERMRGVQAVYITSIVAQLFADLNADSPWKGKLNDVVAKARDYLKQAQVGNPDGAAPDYEKDKAGYGGWAYSKEEIGQGAKPASNMSTSTFAIDALKACGVKQDDPIWERALTFLKRNQNAGEVQDEGWVATDSRGRKVKPAAKDSKDYGGAVYSEGSSAGENENEDGTVTFFSYGSMTYNLLRSYLHAGLKKDSLPVKLAYGWIQRNYTVERVPGFRDPKDFEAGLYYYYMSMGRTLKVLGEDVITEPEREIKHNWREDLIKALAGRQKEDGHWVNDKSSSWRENSPVLCTAYALEALRNTK